MTNVEPEQLAKDFNSLHNLLHEIDPVTLAGPDVATLNRNDYFERSVHEANPTFLLVCCVCMQCVSVWVCAGKKSTRRRKEEICRFATWNVRSLLINPTVAQQPSWHGNGI